nr:MAG TPA: hypothetical protein [Caudoviricetes sp.]
MFSPIFFEKSPTICEKDRSFCVIYALSPCWLVVGLQ